jgi:hypothetical protein
MKLHLVTFADGNPTRREAAHRLAAQANETGWFASASPLHLEDLRALSDVWFTAHQSFIAQNLRGLGYWIWKPFLILERLKQIPPDDCLVYSDAGTEISPLGANRFQHYAGLAQAHGLLAFDIQEPIHLWTKGDLLSYFGISPNSPFLNANQIWAGLLFLRNTPANLLLASHWAELCVARNYSLVNDAASTSPNPPSFKEHRHDQSILSLLLRTAPMPCILPDESYHSDLWKKGTFLPELPFQSFRNPTGTRIIPPQPAN